MTADRRVKADCKETHVNPASVMAAGMGLSVNGVSKTYGRQQVVRDISLDVAPGECLALLGPNGAGKTTLFKMVLGLVRPSGGELRVDDMDPSSLAFRAARKQVGYLPENVSFHAQNTGAEVLSFLARLKGVPTAQCAELLERVSLTEAAAKRVKTYSKGMRQRLGLAQALLGRPRLLILDEPTTGLDPVLRHQFFDILRGLKETGVTIFISSHALTEIEARADRYAVLQDGALTACGTLDALQRVANLPIRISITVAPNKMRSVQRLLEPYGKVTPTGAGRVDVRCQPEEKMLLLKKITNSNIPVEDVDIRGSRLEDIYAHFVEGEVRS